MSIAQRLVDLGLTLPPAAAPMANYVPAVRVGNLLFVSGHVSSMAQPPCLGKVGAEVDTDRARTAARDVAVLLLGTVRASLGDLERVRRVVRLAGMVASAEGFTEQPQVVNGASALLLAVFGEARGQHARVAFGAAELPAGSTVELELLLEVD